MSAWAHLIHYGHPSSQDQTSLFAIRTLDFPSPCNLCVLLKHYCLPPWKQQLLDCLPVYLSPVLLPCWAGETDAFIMSVFCRRGSLLFASHGDREGCKARAAEGNLQVPCPAGSPNGAGRPCAKPLLSAEGRLQPHPLGPCFSVSLRTVCVRWLVKKYTGFQNPSEAAAFHCNYPSHHCAV